MILKNIGQLVTMESALKKSGRRIVKSDLSIISNAALVFDQTIKWVGPQSELPKKFRDQKSISASGGLVTPGFVDSHTHLVFDGDRSLDFENRLSGMSYSEIAAQGGGILTSMRATRAATFDSLLKRSMERLKTSLSQGVTTIEIKTGYGLDFESEKKSLDIISALKKRSPGTVMSTFLAAHALPPEFKNRREEYITEITEKWLPRLKSKIDFVDIFLDYGYFEKADAEKLFSKAKKLKLPVRIHADEIELSGGTEMAAKFGALSADHLLKIGPNEIRVLANSEVTATLVPTTAFFLKSNQAPARALLDAGARVALATDFNPGTSPSQDISLVGLFVALELNMRPEEILTGLSLNGAFALGLQSRKGALLPGHDADFVIHQSDSISRFFYQFGQRKLDVQVFAGGKRV